MFRMFSCAVTLLAGLLLLAPSAYAEDIAGKVRVAAFGFESGMTVAEDFEDYLHEALIYGLMENENVIVVEREMLDKILAEQQLGSSDLADPDTRARLGRLTGARYIVYGVYLYEPISDSISVIVLVSDAETTELKSFEYNGFKDSIEMVLEEDAGPEVAEFLLDPKFN